MIFRQSLLREFGATALGVLVILLAITLTTQFIRFLGQAASGTLVVDAVLAMLGFSALSHLSVLLSLTLFISVLMTLTRSYRDSEMIVWFSSGVSLLRWVRPVLSFSLPMVITIALLSMLSPAMQRAVDATQPLERRHEQPTDGGCRPDRCGRGRHVDGTLLPRCERSCQRIGAANESCA